MHNNLKNDMTVCFLKDTKEKIFFTNELCPKIYFSYFLNVFFGKRTLLYERSNNSEYFCKIWNVKNRKSSSYESLKMYRFNKEFIIDEV